jgi:hypothetical protein
MPAHQNYATASMDHSDEKWQHDHNFASVHVPAISLGRLLSIINDIAPPTPLLQTLKRCNATYTIMQRKKFLI